MFLICLHLMMYRTKNIYQKQLPSLNTFRILSYIWIARNIAICFCIETAYIEYYWRHFRNIVFYNHISHLAIMGIGGGEFWKLILNSFIIEIFFKMIKPLKVKTLLDYPIDHIVKIYHHLVKSVQLFLLLYQISNIFTR